MDSEGICFFWDFDPVFETDIHKKFLLATVLLLDGTKLTKRFSMDLRSLFEFRDWVCENGCKAVAVESTGTYWVLIYRVLEIHVELGSSLFRVGNFGIAIIGLNHANAYQERCR
ncbi:hypothetical protein [Candidatus Methanocrinis natronophilus]|uniref:Transposase IS111A/IS1328/IS1533 N-terminal domain-containing protein n=1 Tax=Candidatus Methanocrinis natronophilus TaxID=3033396 RepID=A0ABT5X4I8_9EURY|nr:hypothetical protein [Candidatus Methanocrinis natronophilus]MDF0589615.1 hypothetical protein [Candidatus Methanocrinis natronophilus]